MKIDLIMTSARQLFPRYWLTGQMGGFCCSLAAYTLVGKTNVEGHRPAASVGGEWHGRFYYHVNVALWSLYLWAIHWLKF